MNSFVRLISCLFFMSSSSYAADSFVDFDSEKFIGSPEEKQAQIQQVRKSSKCDPILTLCNYQMAKDAAEVLDHHQVNYSIIFGTLLGAVRHGGKISHDDDVDFGIRKEDEERLKTTKESFGKLGYNLFTDLQKGHENIVGYKLYSKTPIKLLDGKEIYPFLDLFLFELIKDRYVVFSEKGRKMFSKASFTTADFDSPREYQFGQVKLKGLNNPEIFLTTFYGADWNEKIIISHTHQKSTIKRFKWTKMEEDLAPAQPTGPLKERAIPYFKAGTLPAPLAANNSFFWNTFYQANDVGLTPSTFCQFLIEEKWVKKGATLFEVACGNARDTFAFQKNGIGAMGVDLSVEAIKADRKIAEGMGIDPDIFNAVDVNDLETMKRYKDVDNVYARFFIHSISDHEQSRFFDFLKLTKSGSQLLLEFRTDKDPMFKKSTLVSAKEGVTDHYRRYINFEQFLKQLEEIDYTISYSIEAQDLSVRGEDNPWLGRVIALKKLISVLN